MIDMLRPEATMMLMGVSEEAYPSGPAWFGKGTPMLMGRSRSTKDDFITVRDLLEADIPSRAR